MLARLRHNLQKLTTPSFIKVLDNFNISYLRGIESFDCKIGKTAWLDFPRSDKAIIVNNQPCNFSKKIENYRTKFKELEDYQYRKALHQILHTRFYEISNKNISGPLIDECITMLNQASLHALSGILLFPLGKDMKRVMNIDNDVVPTTGKKCQTNITIISNSHFSIHHESDSIMRLDNGTYISNVRTAISFDINVSEENTIVYSNIKVLFEIPKSIISSIFFINVVKIRNLLCPFKNLANRIKALITGNPFHKVTPHKITRTSDLYTIEHKLPDYKCSPVAIPEIEDKKEKHQQKQQGLYQTRSTFIPPIRSPEPKHKNPNKLNKDSQQTETAPIKIHNPTLQASKEAKNQPRSL